MSEEQTVANSNVSEDFDTQLTEQKKNELEAYIKTSRSEIEGIKAEATSEKNDIKRKNAELEKKISAVNIKFNQLDTDLLSLQSKNDTANSIIESIQNINKNIESSKSQIDTNMEDASNSVASILDMQKESSTIKQSIMQHSDEIGKLRKQLFEDEKNEDGSIKKISTKSIIDELVAGTKKKNDEAEALYNKKKEDFDELYADLKIQILSLLPSAGAAGLSSAYFDAKSRYGIVPYQSTEKDSFVKTLMFVFHHIKSLATTLAFYVLFIAPLYLIYNEFDKFLTAQISPENINAGMLALRIGISIPLLGISLFGLTSISLNRRMYEEYNHKQRVMQLFHSFKEEIDEAGTEEQKKELLHIMLQAVKDKPSLVMSKYEKNIFNYLPSLKKQQESIDGVANV